MRRRACVVACSVLIGVFSGAAAGGTNDWPIFNIPKMDRIKIDGDAADWGERGFRVDLMGSPETCSAKEPEDFDPRFRVGWDDKGVLLVGFVRDDVPVEYSVKRKWGRKDAMSLFLVTDAGANVSVAFSPGRDPRFPDLRSYVWSGRNKVEADELAFTAARTITEDGYCIEIRVDFSDLKIAPAPGEIVYCQVFFTDADVQEDDVRHRFASRWFPAQPQSGDTSRMHRLRLAGDPSPPVLAATYGIYEKLIRTRIDVITTTELAGQIVEVRAGGKTLGAGKLELRDGRPRATIRTPIPPMGQTHDKVSVYVADRWVATVDLPDADDLRARELMFSRIVFEPYCFWDEKLPECDFAQPMRFESFIGPYEIDVTYYDAQFNPVTKAERPGRYGAVIEIKPQNGRAIRRFRTLCRIPKPVRWWEADLHLRLNLPDELEMSPAVVVRHRESLSEYVKRRFAESLDRNHDGAILLAGLYESSPDGPAIASASAPWAADRQWWVTMKRKLYGTDRTWPAEFVCPRPIEGPPARVIREGTLAEAGLSEPGVAAIEQYCRKWVDEIGEAVAVCIVRHGVIALHKAYGQRDGAPMTVDTASWMASITKTLSGSLMMMVVDQGFVDVDEPIDKYIPALCGIEAQTPITIRRLYTHTAGLWGHWGDEMHDLDEIIAGYYPRLKVGRQYEYDGAGYALGGKIMEHVTGEAIPQLYRKHLLDPLGCLHTEVSGTSGDATSTPLDIAKFAQMLLNGGAYGKWRFFSPATAKLMRPVPFTDILQTPPPANVHDRGFGTESFVGEGLGADTFGHGAASGAILRIDPANDLILVLTRNEEGKDYKRYCREFLQTVAAALTNPTATR